MKILFLSRYQGKVNRGAESFVSELSLRLKKDNEVEIFSGEDADSLVKIFNYKPDIVIPMNGRSQALKASLGRLKGKYKLVIIGQSGIGRDDIFNIVICTPDVFVCLTDYMHQWAKKWADKSQLIKISNGVDLKKFNPHGEKLKIDLPRPVILSVGALEWYKHHQYTIEALSLLDKGSLLIVGKGSEKNMLQNLGNQKLKNRFKIMEVNYQDMPKVYKSADLFVLPSWNREAFGIVYIEAMASGLAVVAPDDLPRREIIGDGGILTDVTNPSNYAKGIQDALDKDWGIKPITQAKNFSWDLLAEKYNQLFKNIINE